MPNMPFTLRGATASDAGPIAAVYCASFRLLTFLPMLHTEAEYRPFIANVIFRDCEVTVAEDGSGIVSFLALHGEEVRLLYTRPDRIGLGAGTQLIEAAKKRRVGAGAFRPTLARAASTKREASGRSALPTGRATRRKRPTSATAGRIPPAGDRVKTWVAPRSRSGRVMPRWGVIGISPTQPRNRNKRTEPRACRRKHDVGCIFGITDHCAYRQ